MERISVRGLATAIRLIREPVVVTYAYPRNHPLYGAGEECGVYVPLETWKHIAEDSGMPFPPPAGGRAVDPADRVTTKRVPWTESTNS